MVALMKKNHLKGHVYLDLRLCNIRTHVCQAMKFGASGQGYFPYHAYDQHMFMIHLEGICYFLTSDMPCT